MPTDMKFCGVELTVHKRLSQGGGAVSQPYLNQEADYAHNSTTSSPTPLDFQTFRWLWAQFSNPEGKWHPSLKEAHGGHFADS